MRGGARARALSKRAWKKLTVERRASIQGRMVMPIHRSCFLAIFRKPWQREAGWRCGLRRGARCGGCAD